MSHKISPDFENAFKSTSSFRRLLELGASPDAYGIFKILEPGKFWLPEVQDAWTVWASANTRAAGIAIKMTEIPKNAKNPTRDRIVEVGEHISEAILKWA